MAKVNHITHKKSAVANKAPKVGDLANGEIAVNYAKDSERLYIKNTSDEIIPFSSDHIIMDSMIDTVLASKTMGKGYDVKNPTLANLYGSKESLNSVLSHYKMGLFKDGALVKECAPCRITKAVDGTDISIDGSEGDIMLYIDTPIYRDRCRVSGVTVPNSTAPTHNVIGLGLMPHQVGGKEAKKMNPFAFTPSYVQLDRTTNQYHSCYNPSYSGSGLGDDVINPFFKTNFIGENGAQGGYPVMYQSAIDSMKRSRAKGPKYQGIFYEFYEMWLIAMYLELGSLYFTRDDYFGTGTVSRLAAINPSTSDWISGGFSGVLVNDELGDGVAEYTSLSNNNRYHLNNSDERNYTLLYGLLGGNHCNFEEALETQRFVDALVKSDLASKVDGATVLEYDDDRGGYIKVSNGVDVASGSGMKVGKKYYVIKDVPNCQGIGDGVMTYVLNVFVKTTFNKGVSSDVGCIDLEDKDVIFKFSYPTYRGLELFSGAQTYIEGFNYLKSRDDNDDTNGSLWYAKDYTDIKYDPTNYTTTDSMVTIDTPDENIPFIKGFVKGGENPLRMGYIKNADYDISLFCATELSNDFASESTYDCGYASTSGGNVGEGYKGVSASVVSCSFSSYYPSRVFYTYGDVNSVNYCSTGGFSIGNPSL